ncbi:hypothetical protein SLEP1_g57458 [Rubroshorea leprosula]|uniref:Uncharacterized protein n=1 Tax=Rubroshorea leprosula TaxID=152421 RepID=A0AAV5MPL2_9ROSI|nr:hypothetical protein SLEP1_g57458 [Rubroshorea leprosula]
MKKKKKPSKRTICSVRLGSWLQKGLIVLRSIKRLMFMRWEAIVF